MVSVARIFPTEALSPCLVCITLTGSIYISEPHDLSLKDESTRLDKWSAVSSSPKAMAVLHFLNIHVLVQSLLCVQTEHLAWQFVPNKNLNSCLSSSLYPYIMGLPKKWEHTGMGGVVGCVGRGEQLCEWHHSLELSIQFKILLEGNSNFEII